MCVHGKAGAARSRLFVGVIVNIGSQAGVVALPTESVSCMTKAGVSHLTRCLALEWAPRGVRVNAVASTFVETPGPQKWLGDPPFRTSVVGRIPLGRVGQPPDVTGAVVFLASPAAAMITGETLVIDGGWTVQEGTTWKRFLCRVECAGGGGGRPPSQPPPQGGRGKKMGVGKGRVRWPAFPSPRPSPARGEGEKTLELLRCSKRLCGRSMSDCD